MLFRTRDLLVRQRTQSINALRGHLAEFGIVAPKGPARIDRLALAVDDNATALPGTVRRLAKLLLGQIGALTAEITVLEKDIRRRAPREPGDRALDDYPRRWRYLRDCDPRILSIDGAVQQRARLRGMGWPHAATELHRRQDAARAHVQDGPTRYPPALDHRRIRRGDLGSAQRSGRRIVARADDGPQTAHACRRRARQQDGAHRLGDDDPPGRLPKSRRRLIRRSTGKPGDVSRSTER